MSLALMPTEEWYGMGFASGKEYSLAKKSEDGKTIYWFSYDSQYVQNNNEGNVYYWVAIG